MTRTRSSAEWEVINRRLEAMGLRDPDSGAMRKARASYCQSCRRPVMIGLDAEWCALARRCDPAPLSATGEALALLAGRRTFSLTWMGGRYEIDFRDQWRIRQDPAGCTPGLDVLVEHDCQLVSAYPSIPSTVRLPYSDTWAGLPLDPPY